jgi:hypothetical protein
LRWARPRDGGWFGERHIDDLGKPFEKELEDFFVNYHELVGRTYRILAGAPRRLDAR